MKFIINKQIIFDVDMSTLGLADSQEELIQISNPTKRLLLVLLSHQGEAVNREIIFKKVWDDYGMISSNNNLNQCVSKLRKIMKNLGVDDEVIVTVPKIGFMLCQQISIEQCQETPALQEEHLMPAELVALPGFQQSEMALAQSENLLPLTAGKRLTRSNWFRYFNWIFLFFSIVVLGGASGFWFASKPIDRREVYMGDIGNCKIMISEQALDSLNTPALKKGIMEYAAKLKPHCQGNEYVLVIKSSTFKTYSSDLSRLYFMRCGSLDGNKSEVCWSLTQPQPGGA